MPAKSKQPVRKRNRADLVITRTFAAPRELVFTAWTDPKHILQWWSPRGFTNVLHHWEAKPGGRIHVDMHGPDGMVYPMKGEFREVIVPERIVMYHSAIEDENSKPNLEVLLTVTFDESYGFTELTLRAHVIRATGPAVGAVAGMEIGWNQSLDKFSEHVAVATAKKQSKK